MAPEKEKTVFVTCLRPVVTDTDGTVSKRGDQVEVSKSLAAMMIQNGQAVEGKQKLEVEKELVKA